ncbi:MAG: phosphohydrolase [Verrucomicrobia bacterium]|nr:MAG: phosphohydrolase [Verrucomicrobiota bacterium]
MSQAQTLHLRRLALEIVRRLHSRHHEALFAGGCVRDQLLGIPPHDYDIVTDATPNQIEAIFERTVPVGAQFGVTLVIQDSVPFQIATFRKDGRYLDHRHPEEVSFGGSKEDALRRDFTINGLFEDPLKGSILDYVNGQKDLHHRVVRCIGDPVIRFEEDRLRILRAIRFATVLNFEIHSDTWDALIARAHLLSQISAERIREELNRIFLSSQRIRGFDLLNQSGILKHLLPEIEALKGCEQPVEFHPEGDVFVHTRLMLSLLPSQVSLPLVLAVLFHDLGKPGTARVDETGRIRFNTHEKLSAEMTIRIMKRLRYSNSDIEKTEAIVRNHMAFKDVKNMRRSTLKRFLARPDFEDELELHRVDCLGSHGLLDNYEFLIAKRHEFSTEILVPSALLTGRDLIAMGWKPGPQFKVALEAAHNAQLEGLLSSKEEALAFVAKKFPPTAPNTV